MDCSPLLPSPLVVPNIFLTHPQLIWPLLPLPVHSVLLPLHLSGSLTGQTPVPSLFLPIPTIPLQLCRPSSGTELPCPSLPIPPPTLPRVYPTTPPTPLGPASYELTSTPFSFHYPHLPSPPANWPQPPLCPQLPTPLQLSSAMNWPQILLHPHLSDPPLSNCTDLVRTLCVLILRASLVAQRWSLCLQRRRPGFDPWVRKIPWSRKWQPILVLLPGKFCGLQSMESQRVRHDWATSLSLSFGITCYLPLYLPPRNSDFISFRRILGRRR